MRRLRAVMVLHVGMIDADLADRVGDSDAGEYDGDDFVEHLYEVGEYLRRSIGAALQTEDVSLMEIADIFALGSD